MLADFAAVREKVGEIAFSEELERYGWHNLRDMKAAYDAKQPNVREKIADVYWHLDAIARKEVA